MSWQVRGGHSCPSAFDLGLDPDFGLILNLVLNQVGVPLLSLKPENQANFKGVGQECPTHTF